jgi:hypothetical protein
LVLTVEINSKWCYYKGAVILLAQEATSRRRRRMKKKSIAFVLAGIMLCALATPAFAKRRHYKKHPHHPHNVVHQVQN